MSSGRSTPSPRLHGDEFVILCEDLHHPDEATDIARRLDAALTRPFHLNGHQDQITLTASVGIALADRNTHAPEQVLRNADTAMYEAKRTRREAPPIPD